jgi:hypothetical protein
VCHAVGIGYRDAAAAAGRGLTHRPPALHVRRLLLPLQGIEERLLLQQLRLDLSEFLL